METNRLFILVILIHQCASFVSRPSASFLTSSILQSQKRLWPQHSLSRFSDLAWSRWSNTRAEFDPKRFVDDEIIRSLLNATQSAPSGFNIQPYICVVVRSPFARSGLANAMLGSNSAKIINASFSVVFCADLESSRLLSKNQLLTASTPIHGRLPR